MILPLSFQVEETDGKKKQNTKYRNLLPLSRQTQTKCLLSRGIFCILIWEDVFYINDRTHCFMEWKNIMKKMKFAYLQKTGLDI